MKFKPAPLPSSFFLTSIIGFLIAALYWNFGKISDTWAVTFMLVFCMMFLASLFSMSHADPEAMIAMDRHMGKKK